MQIDLRSDTVTKPTAAMKQAMFDAPVGDDVFGEDPTINALEERAARMFGHEAALFCPSGTQTNQIAIRVHTAGEGEVICDQLAHIYRYEGGGIAANSYASVRLLDGDRGRFKAEDVVPQINAEDIHFPRTRLIALENTCNKGGGSIWNLDDISAVRRVALDHQLPMHLDGARVFNALVAQGTSSRTMGGLFDSISICLSKGLGAPVGSLLIGSKSFIYEARRVRKRMGGGMRQAGILAAAGIYALEHHVDRLADDHRRASILADKMNSLDLFERVDAAETNVVIGYLTKDKKTSDVIAEFKSKGLLCASMGGQSIRFVTHLDYNDDQLERTLDILDQVDKS